MMIQSGDRRIRLGRSWVGLATLLSALGVSTACGSSDEADAAAPPAATGGGAGTGGNAALPTSLAFEPSTGLTLLPGEVRSLALRAQPPGSYQVRLALLGEPKNASLDRSDVVTEPDGKATIVLTAPTSPTTFSIRASAGATVTAQASVSVSDSGFVVLRVEPEYSGARGVSSWTASVRAGASCAELSGNPPPDGDLIATAYGDRSPQVAGVPVGPAFAVTLRAAYFASGCTDLPSVTPDEINYVTVKVVDRPLQMSQTNLDVSLAIQSASADWLSTLEAGAQKAASALLGPASDEVAALLDAMKVAAVDPSAFATARSLGLWDDALRGALGSTPLRELAMLWMRTGFSALVAGEGFAGHLTSAGKGTGLALLDLRTVAGVDARLAGFSAYSVEGTWKADPGDTVLFGTSLFFAPSQLITALALPPARAAVPGATSVAEALAERLSCAEVAALLTAAGALPGFALEGCDAGCVETLCVSAIATLWDRARNASTQDAAALQVSLTGKASIDEHAVPIGFSGSWVGSLGVGSASASVSGPAAGSQAPIPN